VIASNDGLFLRLQKAERRPMKAASITVPPSHVPMLFSTPKEVADLIDKPQRKSGVTEPMTAVKLEMPPRNQRGGEETKGNWPAHEHRSADEGENRCARSLWTTMDSAAYDLMKKLTRRIRH